MPRGHRHFRGIYNVQSNFQAQSSNFPAQNLIPGRPYTVRLEIQEEQEQARGVEVIYTNDPVEAEAWLCNNVIAAETKALGLDMEWKPQFVKKKHGGQQNSTAVLQLSTLTAALVLHIIHLKSYPKYLSGILADQTIAKVGCGIRQDVVKLLRDTGLRCKSAMELGDLALKSGYSKEHGRGLRKLARNVLAMDMHKPKGVQLSNWEIFPLTSSQISYAALDAWVGVKLHSHMMQNRNIELIAKSEFDVPSLPSFHVDELSGDYVRCAVCDFVCNRDKRLQEHLANAPHTACKKCGKMFVSGMPKEHQKICVSSEGCSSQSIESSNVSISY